MGSGKAGDRAWGTDLGGGGVRKNAVPAAVKDVAYGNGGDSPPRRPQSTMFTHSNTVQTDKTLPFGGGSSGPLMPSWERTRSPVAARGLKRLSRGGKRGTSRLREFQERGVVLGYDSRQGGPAEKSTHTHYLGVESLLGQRKVGLMNRSRPEPLLSRKVQKTRENEWGVLRHRGEIEGNRLGGKKILTKDNVKEKPSENCERRTHSLTVESRLGGHWEDDGGRGTLPQSKDEC